MLSKYEYNFVIIMILAPYMSCYLKLLATSIQGAISCQLPRCTVLRLLRTKGARNLVRYNLSVYQYHIRQMEQHLNVLRARQAVLRRLPPPRKLEPTVSWCHQDPFAFESRGFYSSRPTNGDDTGNNAGTKKKKKTTKPMTDSLQTAGGIRKAAKQKARFIPNWTAELDRMLRKCLRKFGWGSWTRMEQSGKFPVNFTRKILARRVKALGYTKEMFTTEN